MQLIVTSNMRDVINELNGASKETMPAVVRSLNRMVDQVKVRSSREVRDAGYKLKISDIKDAIRINRANSSRLRADAVARGRPLSLMKYGARQTKNGVSVDVLNGRKVIAHAFIAQANGGGPQVFMREPSAKHKKVMKNGKAMWSALPIKKLFGPGIPDAMANKAVERAIVSLITERFPIIFEHEHAWLNKRLAKKKALPIEAD